MKHRLRRTLVRSELFASLRGVAKYEAKQSVDITWMQPAIHGNRLLRRPRNDAKRSERTRVRRKRRFHEISVAGFIKMHLKIFCCPIFLNGFAFFPEFFFYAFHYIGQANYIFVAVQRHKRCVLHHIDDGATGEFKFFCYYCHVYIRCQPRVVTE